MTALAAPPIPMQSAPRPLLPHRHRRAVRHRRHLRLPHPRPDRHPLAQRPPPQPPQSGGILIDTASNPATRHPARHPPLRHHRHRHQPQPAAFPPELDPIATSLRRELPSHAHPPPRTPRRRHPPRPRRTNSTHLTQTPAPTPLDLAPYSTWLTNKRVRVEPRDRPSPCYTGTTAGLNPAGFLLVQGDDGQLHTVLSGGLREP